MVLDGAQRGGARSARRHNGFRRLPLTGKPAVRPDGDWYPPSGIPAPTIVDIRGSRRPEIVASVPDGFVYAVGLTGRRLWRYDYTRGAPKTFASEVAAADLNRDGLPELVFGTYGAAPDAGRLVVLSASGRRLHDIRLRHQGTDGNGIGVPAAPSIADLDGDGRLEIVVSTFDHGIDVFRVPRSGTNRLPWPTGRGNLLRNGTTRSASAARTRSRPHPGP
jgi:FG-GAP repeat